MTNLAAQIETATNENMHTEAAIIAADALGGALGTAYVIVLQEIADNHELNGHIEKNQQILRDAIMREVMNTLKLQGKV